MDKDFYTVKEFADKLCVHENTIRRALKNKKIKSIRFTSSDYSRHRIPASEILRMAAVDLEKYIENEVQRRIEERGKK